MHGKHSEGRALPSSAAFAFCVPFRIGNESSKLEPAQPNSAFDAQWLCLVQQFDGRTVKLQLRGAGQVVERRGSGCPRKRFREPGSSAVAVLQLTDWQRLH